MTIAIKIENLSKRYIIGHQRQENYTTLRDILMHKIRGVGQRIRHPLSPNSEEIEQEELWALRDINLDIQQGDRVGIIGRNGAGKSTLLKVLSRVTEPTRGRITMNGRVASLLEVGTGFHPELTGRENIFLNGAILGMSRAEIRRKFDEIVDFSEVEKFLDTPVKRYSTGMYVRLAFAVAAHLEPDILVVDEVLAVGDAQFQKKCLGKMEDVSANEGRTILFVSHQMGAIAQLCKTAVLLEKGRVLQTGPVSEVVNTYMNSSISGTSGYDADPASCSKDIAIISAQTYDEQGMPANCFPHDQEITVEIHCRVNQWVRGAEVRLAVRDTKRNVFTTDTELVSCADQTPGELFARVVIPSNLLRPETYFFTLATYLPNQIIFDLANDALSVTVIDGGSKYAASEGLDYGCVFVDCKWSIKEIIKSAQA